MGEEANVTTGAAPVGRGAQVLPTGLREVFRLWPTGVAVIAGFDGADPIGLTCNSLTSVSLEPQLVGFCVARSSTTWPRLRGSARMCVSLLAQGQDDLGRLFATRHASRFRDIPWHRRRGGPAVAGALAWIDCALNTELDAGDHTMVLATVEDLTLARDGGSPLVFHGGRFAALNTEAAS